MHDLDPYQVDNLLLLIGGNPLPNYVAAQLLAKDRTTTKIILVCSRDTRDEAARRIEQQLRDEGFDKVDYCEVEEANPQNIRNQVTQAIQGLSGSIGLHYTGGTKAMAVHAYLAVQAQADSSTQYSYLDARRLELQIETSGGLHTIPDVGLLLPHPLTIRTLLELHDLNKFKKEMQATPLWPDAAGVLTVMHTDVAKSTAWREWCQGTLRDQTRKGNLKATNKLGEILIRHIPDSAVQEAFLALYPDYTSETAFTALAQAVGIKNSSDDLAKWFDGEWLEHYVLHTLKPLKESGVLRELVMTINPDLGGSDSNFEFDVAGIRGYQLFAFSVSTTSEKRLLKSKLLEAVVRAEQMGGSEARVALVCCASRDDVKNLEREIAKLFRQSKLAKVFGRDDLLDLHDQVAHWINTSRAGE